jgi:hypothetical protein
MQRLRLAAIVFALFVSPWGGVMLASAQEDDEVACSDCEDCPLEGYIKWRYVGMFPYNRPDLWAGDLSEWGCEEWNYCGVSHICCGPCEEQVSLQQVLSSLSTPEVFAAVIMENGYNVRLLPERGALQVLGGCKGGNAVLAHVPVAAQDLRRIERSLAIAATELLSKDVGASRSTMMVRPATRFVAETR